jgi:hypothetical protein
MSTGLERIAKELETIWQRPVKVGEPKLIFGSIAFAGASRPLESSAVEITAGEDSVFVPCPIPTEYESPAAIFRHSGQDLVMPIIRQCNDADSSFKVTYLTLDEWLLDALTVWRFRSVMQSSDDHAEPVVRTIRECLLEYQRPVAEQLCVVARLVRYALFGIDSSHRYSLAKSAGIVLPIRSQWLRPFASGKLGLDCARRQVLTAKLQAAKSGVFVPTATAFAKSLRIAPTSHHDFGVDPVHTPESQGVRLVGRLGCGVEIVDRQLNVGNVAPALSPSTRQIPFAGHNDPRRLLMGANMQVQAIELEAPEEPLVSNEGVQASDSPSGVNLRTAYMAWQGYNHEDAWVISESAAGKLAGHEEWGQTIAIPTIEGSPSILVEKGETIEKGQRLISRSLFPSMLSASLEIWTDISSRESEVVLDPVPEELAKHSSKVVAIEIIDFLDPKAGLRECVPEDLSARYRQLVRITLRRSLAVCVGDKLANRHGHKGIVGAIVPDEDMPQFRGQPLEALIDPISVMNRSNWGQVFETVLGGEASKTQSQSVATISANDDQKELVRRNGNQEIGPPVSGKWLTTSVQAIAGSQFVMRLPHIASEKISLASGSFGNGKRPQRFGEMESWALWAHQGGQSAMDQQRVPSFVARKFLRLLFAAGYESKFGKLDFSIYRLRLSTKPPKSTTTRQLSKSKLSDAVSEAITFDEQECAALIIEPPIEDVKLPQTRVSESSAVCERQSAHTAVSWLPLLPLRDRRPRRLPSGAEVNHDLTIALRKIARLVFYRQADRPLPSRGGKSFDVDKELKHAIEAYLRLAYGLAVGLKSVGELSSKTCFLRRKLMGKSIRPSVRATAAPAGTIPLGVDDVGISPAMARTLLNQGDATVAELERNLSQRSFWLKRDPVLHRYGLIQVKARMTDGDVIRLPASMLGPLGADFDGDTVALFSALPNEPTELVQCRPSRLAWDDTLGRAMFAPGKQFRFGLGSLMQDPQRLANLQAELAAVNAPMWDEKSDSPASAFDAWIRQAWEKKTTGDAWAVLEKHAIDALAINPGMNLSYQTGEVLAALPMVQWSAAKRDIFQLDHAEIGASLQRVLSGQSLSVYQRDGDPSGDPIASVMVAAKESVGKFGGSLRRLLYAVENLDSDVIAAAQTLTEQATQRALSVKAGKSPLRFASFNREINALLKGETSDRADGDQDVSMLMDELSDACQRVRHAVARNSGALHDLTWLAWLRSPHRLAELVTNERPLVIPTTDIRFRTCLCENEQSEPNE